MKITIFFQNLNQAIRTRTFLLIVLLFLTDQDLYPSYDQFLNHNKPPQKESFEFYDIYQDTSFVFPFIPELNIISKNHTPNKPKIYPSGYYESLLTYNQPDTTIKVVIPSFLVEMMIPFLKYTDKEDITLSITKKITKKNHLSTDVKKTRSIHIMGEGTMNTNQMFSFLIKNNPEADADRVRKLINIYFKECHTEGVNHDVAFIQMCHETGFLRYDGVVKESQNNFCGLGTINSDTPGEVFKNAEEGIRAHIQHLKAYASTEELKHELVDQRFRFVERGTAPVVKNLTGKWAADPHYDKKILGLFVRAHSMVGKPQI